MRRKIKNDALMSIVCQFHCKNMIPYGEVKDWNDKLIKNGVILSYSYSVMSWAEYGAKNGDDIGFLGEFFNSKESFKLLKSDGDGCSSHEAYDRRVG